MLVLLVVSYTQVIAAHPDGGGAYAVAKRNLGRWPAACSRRRRWSSTTCSPSPSALRPARRAWAACSRRSSHHLLLVSLIGLALLTAVNMFGITESAKLLMLPTAVFIVSIFAVIVVGAVPLPSGRR